MAWRDIYVQEKLREFDKLNARNTPLPLQKAPRRPKPVVGPIARRAGRALRRFGEGLESWGAPAPAERASRAQYR